MKKSIKILTVIASILLLVGGAIFTLSLAAVDFDFSKLSTEKPLTNEHSVAESFTDISVKTSTSDIIFALSDDGSCKVVCNEIKNIEHTVNVENGTLIIKEVNNRKWYQHIGILWSINRKVTVYLPKTDFDTLTTDTDTGDVLVPSEFEFGKVNIEVDTGDVKLYAKVDGTARIESDTGDIKLDGTSIGKLELEVDTGDVSLSAVAVSEEIKISSDTGKVKLTNVTCKNTKIESDTGDIKFKNVLVSGDVFIEIDTGDVTLEASDANYLNIRTDTGDVKGSLLTPKHFIASSKTGNVIVPSTSSEQKCEIKCRTGDIRFN